MDKKNDSKSTVTKHQIKIGEKTIEISLNYLARQANGSALVKMGETVVLVTAVMSKKPKEDLGFFPLTVEYEENYWAAGKIRGSRFMKRKGRPTDEAVLSARLIDRSIRPLFPKGMRNEIQIVISVLSFDFINDALPLAVIGASLALETSDIPFEGPLAGVMIGEKEGEVIVNPTLEEQKIGAFSIFVSGVGENIVMVEAGAKEVDEEMVLKAFAIAQTENKKLSDFIGKTATEYGKQKIEPTLFLSDKKEKEALKKEFGDDFAKIFDAYKDKLDYEEQIKALEEKIVTEKTEDDPEKKADIKEALYEIHKEIICSNVLNENKRLGGRKMDEVRPLSLEISLLPRTHGSALFNRGETQGLTAVTLGPPGDELILDGMSNAPETKQNYIHYYDFPPYSVGECAPMRGPGRREIGHGALGEKSLVPVIPSREEFPYTIMLQTEILGSDGSTSMASVCGSTLALMDAGVPIKDPVAGVAMGLIIDEESKKYQVLTDLCANEDFAGHMDFKVAGTKKGITALQMDIKVKGLSLDILKNALEEARKGRLFILGKMQEVIEKPRPELSPYAPRVETLTIDPDKIRTVIGPGGKMINSIIDKTGVSIDIEDDGTVFVASSDADSMKEAIATINSLVEVPKVGKIYTGEVTRIMEFGAFVKFLPNQEGLVHISKLGQGKRVEHVEDVVHIGDKIEVKIEEIDNLGRNNLILIKKLEN